MYNTIYYINWKIRDIDDDADDFCKCVSVHITKANAKKLIEKRKLRYLEISTPSKILEYDVDFITFDIIKKTIEYIEQLSTSIGYLTSVDTVIEVIQSCIKYYMNNIEAPKQGFCWMSMFGDNSRTMSSDLLGKILNSLTIDERNKILADIKKMNIGGPTVKEYFAEWESIYGPLDTEPKKELSCQI